jgi:hypothetical protein
MSKQLLPPVSIRTGAILHDTDYARGAASRAEAAAINAEEDARHGHHRWGVEYVREPVEPFKARLRFKEMYRSGHSAYSVWEDQQGRNWPILLADLADLLTTANLDNGWTEPYTWEVTKRGTAYGIRKVK